MYELQPNYDRAKSFYRKAFVEKREGGIDLYSYDSGGTASLRMVSLNLSSTMMFMKMNTMAVLL